MPGNRGYRSRNPFKGLVTRQYRASEDDVEIDQGVMQLLARPKVLSIFDDHFNLPTLDGKWIQSLSSSTFDLMTMPGWLGLNGRIIMPLPSGDWVIETEFMIPTFTAAGFHIGGLLLHDTATNTGTQAIWLAGMDNSVTASYFQFAKHINGVFSSAYFQATGMQRMDYGFLRITKSGTNYACDYSSHSYGKRWSRINSTSSLTFTPAYFGLYAAGKCYFNYFVKR
jgi:hypothetical protein